MPTRARARQVALGAAAVVLVAAVGVRRAARAAGHPDRHPHPAGDPAGPVLLHRRGRARHHLPLRASIATGDTVWTRLARRPDRLLHQHRHRRRTWPTSPAPCGSTSSSPRPTAGAPSSTSGPAAALEDGTATASVAVDPAAAAALLDRHYAEIGSPGGLGDAHRHPGRRDDRHGRGPRLHRRLRRPGWPSPWTRCPCGRPATRATVLAPSATTAVEVDEVVPRSLRGARPVGADRRRPDGRRRRPRSSRWWPSGAGAWIGRTGRGDVADQFLVRHADRILPVASFSPGADGHRRVRRRVPAPGRGAVRHRRPAPRRPGRGRLRRPGPRRDLPLRRPRRARPSARQAAGPGAGAPRRRPRTATAPLPRTAPVPRRRPRPLAGRFA